MKTKLIQTKDYLLLIDKEAEIKAGDFITDTHIVWQWKDDSSLLGRKLVIAYYPLSEEAKELDLPLLPNPFEEINIEDLSEKANGYAYYGKPLGEKYLAFKEGFIEGYKTAQSKQFSLEDVKKAIQMARELTYFGTKYLTEEIIDVISAQKLPKEFVPEYQKDWKEATKMLMESMGDSPEDFKYEETLKTITNSEGKKEIQGTYKY